MDIKQFLVTALISLSLITSIHAEDQTLSQADELALQTIATENSSVKVSREEEIAFEILNKTITVHDSVTYKDKEYKIAEFNTTTNQATPGYYTISYGLEKDVTLLGLKIGKQTISVTIRDGQYPEYPHYRIKNPDAVNDIHYSIKTYSYFNPNKLGSWLKEAGNMTAALSTCGIIVAVVTPFSLRIAQDLAKKINLK